MNIPTGQVLGNKALVKFAAYANRLWSSPTLTTWLSFLARSLGMLLLMPIVVLRLESAEVTVWFIFLTLISLQSVADFGFSPTFSRIIAYTMSGISSFGDIGNGSKESSTRSTPNFELLTVVVSTMKSIYTKMSLIAFVVLGTAGTIVLWRPISRVPSPTVAWIAWVIVVFSIIITFWGSYLSSYLQGLNRIAILRRWESFWTVSGIVATTIVAFVGMGLLPIVITMQFFNIAGVIWNYRLVSNIQAQLLPLANSTLTQQNVAQKQNHLKVSTSDVVTYIWPSAWRSGLGALCASVLMHHGPGLIYAQSSDSRSVVSFLFSMRFMVAISQFSQAPFYSKIPAMARLYAVGDHRQLMALSNRGMQYSYLVFATVVFAALGFGILLNYVAKDRAEFVSPFFWSLLSLGFFLERLGAMNIQLYSLSNHIVWHIANGLTGLIYLGCCAALWPALNVFAFPLAMILAYSLFYTPYSLWLSHRLFNLHGFSHEWRNWAIPTVIVLSTFSLFAYHIHKLGK